MADKPEMTLERIAERINEVGNRIFTQNVFRARELHECANELRALSTPRITRQELRKLLHGYCADWYSSLKPGTRQMEAVEVTDLFIARLRELGIAVDPPTEADNGR